VLGTWKGSPGGGRRRNEVRKLFRAFALIIYSVSSPVPAHSNTTRSEDILTELVDEADEMIRELFGKSSAYNYVGGLIKHTCDWVSLSTEKQFRSVLQGTSRQGMGAMSMGFLKTYS